MNRPAPKGNRPATRSLATRSFRDQKNQQPQGKPLIVKPLVKKPKKAPSVPKVAIQKASLGVKTEPEAESPEEETKAEEGETLSGVTYEEEPRVKCPELIEDGADIWEHMTAKEEQWRVDPCYLRQHRELTTKLRSYLVRLMFKTCRRFELTKRTLHLGVLYMDLYFSRKFVFKSQLVLMEVANCCLWLAMKWEEIYPPELDEWLNPKEANAVIKREADVVSTLGWDLGHYTVRHFSDILLWRRTQARPELTSSARTDLLTDLSLFDLHMRQFPAFELANILQVLGEGRQWRNDDEKLVLACKWMVERNSEAMSWLIERFYPSLADDFLR